MKDWRVMGGPPALGGVAWERQHVPPEGAPHGWVQWKGTNVCMDVHCACGALCHVDAEFAYYVRCGVCGAVYMVNGHVELVPLTADEAASLGDDGRVVEANNTGGT